MQLIICHMTVFIKQSSGDYASVGIVALYIADKT